jgi:hypothetical protein
MPMNVLRLCFLNYWIASFPLTDYYGPDGDKELSGYPAVASVSDAVKDEILAKQLWDFAENATKVYFPN